MTMKKEDVISIIISAVILIGAIFICADFLLR